MAKTEVSRVSVSEQSTAVVLHYLLINTYTKRNELSDDQVMSEGPAADT